MARSLKELAEEVVSINRANGWDTITEKQYQAAFEGFSTDYRKLGTILCLIHSEVSEGLEALRDGDMAGFEFELADIVIRCLDLAGGAGIDIQGRVEAKMERNRGRGHKHGGKAF